MKKAKYKEALISQILTKSCDIGYHGTRMLDRGVKKRNIVYLSGSNTKIIYAI